VPAGSPVLWYDGLLPALTGAVHVPGLHLCATIRYLERPIPRRRWWGPLRNPTAREWLIADNGLDPAQAATILGQLGLPPQTRTGLLGWNERTMLALETCLVLPPDVLVIDTMGNDAVGAQRVFERLASRPRGLALVYLKTYHSGPFPCLPGASCLALALDTLVPAAAE
jgi:hypothetical protein